MIAWTIYVTFGGAVLLLFPQPRFVSVFPLIRISDRAKIFPDRDLWLDKQGIGRDEANSLFLLWRRTSFHRNPRRLCNRRLAGLEPASAIQVFATAAIVGISDIVSRIRRPRRHLAFAHLGADWSRRGADCRFDAIGWPRNEGWWFSRPGRGGE